MRAQIAEAFQKKAITRSGRAVQRVLKLWQRVPLGDLDTGWDLIAPELSLVVAQAVAQNAADAGTMVSRIASTDRVAAGDVIVPNAFLGVDNSGRAMESLFHGAVTTTKQGIKAGMGAGQAFVAGSSYLASMTKTVIADMARSATSVASTGREYTRYVRVVNPGACSRCAILAGSDRFKKHFERHPACRCTSVPVRGDDDLDDLIISPREHFESLSEAEQDRVYTKAGAEAIRLGADPIQVVGARRGAAGMRHKFAYPVSPDKIRRMHQVPIGVRPDGTRIMGYVTVEGTTRFGTYGSVSGGRTRLMPETIMQMTDDVNMRRVLLRDAGYLEIPQAGMTSSEWMAERINQRSLDRVAADTFYRSLGIDLY